MLTRERRNEYAREWARRNAAHLKDVRAKAYKAIQADPERKARRLAEHREQDAKPRLKALSLLGCKCVQCGESDPIVLQIDHVNSDGSAHRGRFSGTRAVYNDIVANWESGAWQVLCCRCNSIKRYTHHEWGTGPVRHAPPTDPAKLYAQVYNANPVNVARAKEKRVARMSKLRHELLTAYGGCCARCGFKDPRALQIDHVEGGGSKHWREAVSQTSFMKEMLASVGTGRFQCLCTSCNWRKRYERNETTLGKSPGPKKRKSRAKNPSSDPT